MLNLNHISYVLSSQKVKVLGKKNAYLYKKHNNFYDKPIQQKS